MDGGRYILQINRINKFCNEKYPLFNERYYLDKRIINQITPIRLKEQLKF